MIEFFLQLVQKLQFLQTQVRIAPVVFGNSGFDQLPMLQHQSINCLAQAGKGVFIPLLTQTLQLFAQFQLLQQKPGVQFAHNHLT